MPFFRCTAFFSQGNTGWSETYYKETTNPGTLAPPLAGLMEKRVALLNDNVSVVAVRVSQEGAQRVSKLYLPGDSRVTPGGQFISIPKQGTIAVAQNEAPADQVRACLHLDLSKAGVKIALRYLAGIPDAVTKTETATVDFTNPPFWWARFRTFTNYWIADGWGLKALDKGLGNPEKPIIGWTIKNVAPSVLGFVMAGAASFNPAVGSKVNVRGVRMRADGIRSPNGAWIVESVDENAVLGTTTVYLRGATGFDPADIRVLGKARPNLPAYVVPDVIEPLRAGVHKRGKPFNSPRGRVRRIRYAN